MTSDLKQKRRNHTTKRLDRLKTLRQINAPLWVIKSEQIALFLNSKGRKNYGIGKSFSKKQAELYEKYVQPLMGMESEE